MLVAVHEPSTKEKTHISVSIFLLAGLLGRLSNPGVNPDEDSREVKIAKALEWLSDPESAMKLEALEKLLKRS